MKGLKDTEDEDTQSWTKVGSSWLARLPLVYDLIPTRLLEEPLQEEEEMAEEQETRIYIDTREKAARAVRCCAPPLFDFEPLVVKPYSSISDPLSVTFP